jgi:hypothetical protein
VFEGKVKEGLKEGYLKGRVEGEVGGVGESVKGRV